MTIKKCSSGHIVTTKNLANIVRVDYSDLNLSIKKILQFDCPICKTSLSVNSRKVKNDKAIPKI